MLARERRRGGGSEEGEAEVMPESEEFVCAESGTAAPTPPPRVPFPTDAARARHALTHVPYAAWCSWR
eukprot:6886130-Heterocapsa_arctica.AAC.1